MEKNEIIYMLNLIYGNKYVLISVAVINDSDCNAHLTQEQLDSITKFSPALEDSDWLICFSINFSQEIIKLIN